MEVKAKPRRKLSTSISLSQKITNEMVRLSRDGSALRRKLAIEEIKSKWADRFSDQSLNVYDLSELNNIRRSARLNEIADREEDSEALVRSWNHEAYDDAPATTLTVADEADVRRATYTPASLAGFASESFTAATINTDTLTREQVADLARVLKPGSSVTWGKDSEE